MIDALKDYLTPKRFGVVAYVCLIVHFLCGLTFTAVTSTLRASEVGKFSCAVDTKSTAVFKSYVEKTCFSRYERTYNFPLPLYGFVLLSFGLTVLVSVAYSLLVSSRVDEITDRTSNGSEELRSVDEEVSHNHTFYVFYSYFIHLVVRSLFGILFTVLQYTIFYPSGFDFKFSCSLPITTKSSVNNATIGQSIKITSIACKNSTAPENVFWGIAASVVNVVVTMIIFGEVIYLWQRSCSEIGWNCDAEFITVYFLRKRYTPVNAELTSIDNNTAAECTELYKQHILHSCTLSDLDYGKDAHVDCLYIDLIIQIGRASHKFLKEMKSHSKYNVYTKVPENSRRLEKIEDLFHPNDDTKGIFPRTILVVGRPGIGKTVLTEKVIRDWANGIDEFYVGLSDESFKCIFEEILKKPEKAILVFDGLDEFHGDFMNCLDQARILLNDSETGSSAFNFFIKLVCGKMLPMATVLVTSRPTAEFLYSKLEFSRHVEILGFTSKAIEQYVSRFCENNNRCGLTPKVWNHIKSSLDLLNLCYVPVNCFVVCVTLCGCLIDSNNDTVALPTTLTELYQSVISHFGKRHSSNLNRASLEQTMEKLQYLAFCGMETGQLVFNQELIDEETQKCGLVTSLSNPIYPIKIQFCFIHLTIQEFLAARHVIETLAPGEVYEFISARFESSKWHLVLQFIAGLLGEKMKIFPCGYQDCFLAFTKMFTLSDGVINLGEYCHVFALKCLREVNDEDMVKKACEMTHLNYAKGLRKITRRKISPSDFAAVISVCKHLNNLLEVDLKRSLRDNNSFLEFSRFLQQRCLERLNLREVACDEVAKKRLIEALIKPKCVLNHEHTKLRRLYISIGVKDSDISSICTFIKNGRASHLQKLNLSDNEITANGISQLCEVFCSEHCRELTCLKFSGNRIGDEGMRMLCDGPVLGLCNLAELVLHRCSVTDRCMRRLSEALCSEGCKLTKLSLNGNAITDKGMDMLCTDALGRKQCKLAELSLDKCELTDQCLLRLCETLQLANCSLTELSVRQNDFTKEGKCLLYNVEMTENCNARCLGIYF